MRVRHHLVFSVCFAVWCACKAPLVFRGTQKLYPLVFSVFFLLFIFAAGRIHEARVSEKQKQNKKRGLWGSQHFFRSKISITSALFSPEYLSEMGVGTGKVRFHGMY